MKTIEQLKHYDNLYFNEGVSEITDTEYDILKTKAKKENPNDPYFLQVGIKIQSKFEEIKLPFTMGGLEKVDSNTVDDWIIKEPFDIVCSEKLDGNSIGCIWENGNLIFAASRGDGETGQNILQKIKYSIPNIPIMDKVSLRGEIILEGDIYKELGFKNRRNAIAGLLRRDLIEPDILKKLSVVFYKVVSAPLSLNLKSEIDRFVFIESLGLKTPRYCVVPIIQNFYEYYKEFEKILIQYKSISNYDIDGLVLTRNNSEVENVMSPKNSVKFKVNESAVFCDVIDVEWNVTRLGYIKPVILINPTEILGATVSRASGFNVEYIIDNLIGPGSKVGIVRSGDVIPYVTEVIKQSDKLNIPNVCPDCKTYLIRQSKELVCKNPRCFSQNIKQVSYFFTRMGVEGFSEKTVETIGISSIPEMYNIKEEQLEKIPGFGKKKAKLVIDQIKKTLVTKPELLLSSFGIPLIGRTLSKQLCSKFKFNDLFNIKDPDVLGIGEITSKSLINQINNYKYLYEYLKTIGLKFYEEDNSKKTLKNISFALTGDGPLKRNEIQKIIESLGGEVKGINKSTTYLVTNDPNSKSGKMSSALKFNIPVITYKELFDSFLLNK